MRSRLELIPVVMFTLLCYVSVSGKKHKVRHGPSGMSFNDSTTCAEFSKFGRFNPYSVLFEKWVVFYYWAPPRPLQSYVFTFPTANHTKHLHKILDGNTILPVNWKARHILMEDHNNETSLLVERGDRGEYWLYLLYRVTRGMKITPRDIRLKQTGDNRILGLMDCEAETLLVMSRINDVPPQKHLQDEAARLGFRGRRGKSYLYQGHEWMPIPEDDERRYWAPTRKPSSEKSSNDVKNPEQRNKEFKTQPTKEPEESNESKTEAQLHAEAKEKELKEDCVEIKPVYYFDPDKQDSTYEPTTEEIGKLQINSIEADEIATMQYVNAPDGSLSSDKLDNNLGKESESTQINNKLDYQQESNAPKKEQTARESEVLDPHNEQIQSIKEPDNRTTLNSGSPVGCIDCNESEYLKSTDTLYISENSRSDKNLENTQTAREPVSSVSSKSTPQSSNEPVGLNVVTESSPQTFDASANIEVSTERPSLISKESESSQTANNPVSPEPYIALGNSSS